MGEMDKKMSRWGVVFSAPPGMNEHTPVNDSIGCLAIRGSDVLIPRRLAVGHQFLSKMRT